MTTKIKMKLKKDHVYTADIELSFFESMVDNKYIADLFENGGFADAIVTGEGNLRHAKGKWNKEGCDAPLDEHIQNVREQPPVHVPMVV